MRLSKSITFSIGVITTAAMLAGCNGAGSPPSGVGMAPLGHNDTGAFLGVTPPVKIHTDHRKSWVSPDLQRARHVLFVSDYGNGDVYIFTLPAMALKGTLTGLSGPAGECADTHGNIWIVASGSGQILQYTHAGTLLRTLNTPNSVSCAIDPATGNLAVTDAFGVLVFAGASGTPTRYTCTGMFQYDFDGYGPGGSFRVSGTDIKGKYLLCAGTPNALSVLPISGGTIYYPGSVQWDNARSQWVAFDQSCSVAAACSYPVSDSGALGPRTIYLNSRGGILCDLVQAVIAPGDNYVAGSDFANPRYCPHKSQSFRWAYPAGGTATNASNITESEPFGAAISI